MLRLATTGRAWGRRATAAALIVATSPEPGSARPPWSFKLTLDHHRHPLLSDTAAGAVRCASSSPWGRSGLLSAVRAARQPRLSTASSLVRPLSDQRPSTRENIYTVPNFLTVARLATSPFIGYCILHDQPGTALSLLVAAGVTDLLDGWIARRWQLRTVVGSVLDPMADKALMTVLAVSLAAEGGLPWWVAALILGRDVGLAVAAVYYRWISLPPPKTMARYWDFSLPSAEVRPTTISKYNTFLQLALMAATTAAPVLAASFPAAAPDLGPALTVLQYVVATTTVWSGLSYVFSKDAVQILSRKSGSGRSGTGGIKKGNSAE